MGSLVKEDQDIAGIVLSIAHRDGRFALQAVSCKSSSGNQRQRIRRSQAITGMQGRMDPGYRYKTGTSYEGLSSDMGVDNVY